MATITRIDTRYTIPIIIYSRLVHDGEDDDDDDEEEDVDDAIILL